MLWIMFMPLIRACSQKTTYFEYKKTGGFDV